MVVHLLYLLLRRSTSQSHGPNVRRRHGTVDDSMNWGDTEFVTIVLLIYSVRSISQLWLRNGH